MYIENQYIYSFSEVIKKVLKTYPVNSILLDYDDGYHYANDELELDPNLFYESLTTALYKMSCSNPYEGRDTDVNFIPDNIVVHQDSDNAYHICISPTKVEDSTLYWDYRNKEYEYDPVFSFRGKPVVDWFLDDKDLLF